VGQPAQRHRGQTAVLGGGLVRRSVARRTASRVARAPTEKRSGAGATTELVSTAALTRQVDVAQWSLFEATPNTVQHHWFSHWMRFCYSSQHQCLDCSLVTWVLSRILLSLYCGGLRVR